MLRGTRSRVRRPAMFRSNSRVALAMTVALATTLGGGCGDVEPLVTPDDDTGSSGDADESESGGESSEGAPNGCTPGEQRCEGSDALVCDDDGSGWTTTHCS